MPNPVKTYSARTITIVRGVEPFINTRKRFGLDEDGLPVVVGQAQHANHYTVEYYPLEKRSELESLRDIIAALQDDNTVYRIHGVLNPERRREEAHRRTNQNFVESPHGYHLLLLDVDGWPTEVRWWESPAALREAVHTALLERGLGYLATQPMLCVLSQSAWPGKPVLKVHLYLWLHRPLNLESIRHWAKVVNHRCGERVIDHSVYWTVQPDYITRRECVGALEETLDPEFRIQLLPPRSVLAEGEAETAYDGIAREVENAPDQLPPGDGTGHDGAAEILQFDGSGWEMAAQAGTSGEINAWCFPAAAKIVEREGTAEVRGKLNAYARKLHEVAWYGTDGLGGIAVNSQGLRGGPDDAATYGIDRFKQYFRSALDKGFGSELDRCLAVVREALPGGATSLLREPILDAAATLYRRWLPHYESLRQEVQRSRQMRISTWDQQVAARANAQDRRRRIDEDEAMDALSAVGGLGGVVSDLVTETGSLREMAFYNAVANTFDWLADSEGMVLIDRMSPAAQKGGYYSVDISLIKGIINRRGLELLQQVNDSLRLPQGTAAMVGDLIHADLLQRREEREDGLAPSKVWGPRLIRNRFHVSSGGEGGGGEGGGAVLWVNLGIESDGRFCCMRCDSRGLERMTWLEALERYPDAPVWHGAHTKVSLEAGHNDIGALAGVDVDALAAAGGVRGVVEDGVRDGGEEWCRKLFQMIRVSDLADEVRVVAWLVAVILDWDTKFILQLNGIQGAGKSTAATILSTLVNPQVSTTRGDVIKQQSALRLGSGALEPNNLSHSLRGQYTAVIDNVEGLSGQQQERLCTVATGLNLPENIKYTNITMNVLIRASLIVTGLSQPMTRSDLLDRTLTVDVVKRRGGWGDVERVFAGCRQDIVDGLLRLALLVLKEVSRLRREDQRLLEGVGGAGDDISRASVDGPSPDGSSGNPMDARGRHLLVDVVSRLYAGEAGQRAVQAHYSNDQIEMLMGNRFGGAFCAWLSLDTHHWGWGGRYEGQEVPVGDLYESFKLWFYEGPYAGKVVRLSVRNGSNMAYFSVTLRDNFREKKRSVPADTRSFGRNLSKLAVAVSKYLEENLTNVAGQSERSENCRSVLVDPVLLYKRGGRSFARIHTTVDDLI